MPAPGIATATSTSRLVSLVGLVIAVATLHAAQDILVPFALAVLFSFLLAPLASRLESWRVPRAVAVLLVSVFAFTGVGVLGWVVVNQGVQLTAKLPEYRDNIRSRVRSLKSGESALAKAAATIGDIGKDITETESPEDEEAEEEPGYTGDTRDTRDTGDTRDTRDTGEEEEEEPEAKPVPVEVVPPPVSPVTFLARSAGPLLAPLATAGMVLVLVVFLLLRREDLRDRFILLAGRSDPHVTTQALQEASRRVSRYLLMQLCVNSVYAVPIAIGLLLIGVPNALLWAFLGLLLRFIPYVGPIIAAAMPIVLSLAVFEDWTHPLFVIGLYVVVELIVNNVIEPWLYGSSTGLSPVAVIVAAIFWTWLWGPVGLLLATPITATLVAFGKHLPQLGFFHVLLGDDPVATTEWRFYQRLCAADQEEAAEIAEEELERTGSLLEVMDEVVLPALRTAEEDLQTGRLAPETARFVVESLGEIAEMLLERAPEPTEPLRAAGATELGVVCLPARDQADEAAGRMLAAILNAWGCRAEAVGIEALVSERLDAVARSGAAVVCTSAVPPSATGHARHLYKRLQRRFPDVAILTGLWLSRVEPARARERLGSRETDRVVTTFREAIDEIRRQSALRRAPASAQPTSAAPRRGSHRPTAPSEPRRAAPAEPRAE